VIVESTENLFRILEENLEQDFFEETDRCPSTETQPGSEFKTFLTK